MGLIYENSQYSEEENNEAEYKVLNETIKDKANKLSTLREDDLILDEGRDGESNLTDPIFDLIDNYSQEAISSQKHYTPIHVDEIASRLSKFYEKIRKIIDWKDDNALRRGAIERILKRLLFPNLAGLTMRKADAQELAETVTVELIRGGHLPNDSVPMERQNEVAKVLKKYIVFLKTASSYDQFAVKQKINYVNFILEIASCEIEEVLTNPVKEYGMITAMTKLLQKRIDVVPKDHLKEEDFKKFIFIATIKTLYDLDDNFIIYVLLKQKYPDWNNSNNDNVEKIARELPKSWQEIEDVLANPALRKFTRVAEKVDTVFVLIDDIMTKFKGKPEKILLVFEDQKKFEKEFTEAYQKRYSTLKTRLFRLAVFSTLSVFLSNWLTFFLFEVPLAKVFYEGFNLKATIVDFVLPTAVMFFLVSIIRMPKKKNIIKVTALAHSFVYREGEKQHYRISFDNGKPSLLKIIMYSIYLELVIFVFAGIAYVFYIMELPITSVIFDTFTISLTVFAAVAIKNKSRELNVDDETSVGGFLLDMLSVPVAKVGSYFAKKWKEYNVIAIFFNFLVETPFAVILNAIQGWSDFIIERREEIH